MHHPTDRIAHTTAFVTPVVEHWLEREIAQWVHPMKDRSDDPSHHERTLLPRSYVHDQDHFISQGTISCFGDAEFKRFIAILLFIVLGGIINFSFLYLKNKILVNKTINL